MTRGWMLTAAAIATLAPGAADATAMRLSITGTVSARSTISADDQATFYMSDPQLGDRFTLTFDFDPVGVRGSSPPLLTDYIASYKLAGPVSMSIGSWALPQADADRFASVIALNNDYIAGDTFMFVTGIEAGLPGDHPTSGSPMTWRSGDGFAESQLVRLDVADASDQALSSIGLGDLTLGGFAFDTLTYTASNGTDYKTLTVSGLSVALDEVSSAPEPAAWGMMTIGFGIVGAALRRRRRALPA